ncbi:dihydrofolate reductase [Candidatus Riesia pediculicola]|uniref:dihydrofolate reductase n=1 Tax=Riesia pediculicola (strain USDA) TaxID=515618 RepID=D4G8G5_RIEPU|nr:dihydrofolate reductase [Candidatus Riesia pediculicola]ADD79808.1 dihydrofolate reductase [Candidatus Riesia pediculicola USDA]ARC53849.1 hypothetical protein AOE55_01660 [Candidatus Riesia pediculicola]ARC54548.1 hypothetical protein AOE56_01905 [Candidatus Riesia pediculicola]QOJ86481.1 dihydrofolate reductase [Candidatus Riesia pediculicola]
MKKISLIAAISKFNFVIGYENDIPWKLPDDLSWFKKKTIKKPIIVGRTTHECIGTLPDRLNIIMTNKRSEKIFEEEKIWVTSREEALLSISEDIKEIMVIGGEKIYKLFFPIADRLYITYVDYFGLGDVFFPFISKNRWRCSYIGDAIRSDHRNSHSYIHKIFDRKEKYL